MDQLIKEFNKAEREQFDFLSNFIKVHQPKKILEIGTGWGLSACAFLLNNPDATLLTIDPREELNDFERRTKMMGVRNRITRIHGRSGKNCDDKRYWTKKFNILEGLTEKFDAIYIDGSHSYDDVFYDLTHSLNLIQTNGTILLDDYFHKENFTTGYGVAKATSEITKSKNIIYKVHPVAHGMAEIKN